MKRLLTIEIYKNLSYRPFKIFTSLYFIILIALLFIGLVDIKVVEGLSINLKQQGIYNFPEIWNFTTYIVALLKIFLGLIIVFSICQEFTNRMFKQNTIDGLSRKEFIISKLLTILTFSGISTMIVFFLTLIIGYQYSVKTDLSLVMEEIFFIPHYFLKLFSFFCLLMFISILFKKSIFVFLSFVFYWICEGVLSGIEGFMRLKSGANPMIEQFSYTSLLPLKSMSDLIPNPYARLSLAKAMGFKYQFHYPIENVIACLVWTAFFILGSYWILKKRDW